MKKALSRLEKIHYSRIISFRFGSSDNSQDISDSSTVSALDTAAPGASPNRPFIIHVTRVHAGVADVAESPTKEGKAASGERPVGWATCEISAGSAAQVDILDGITLIDTRILLRPGRDLFYANLKRPFAGLRNSSPLQVVQIIMLPSLKIAYINAECPKVLVGA
ncbi:hypothetical protein DL93DRAFT_2080961 [Clavulina sp. PMI_390]|nr:hypothetical protein DL93DRAFT_2080961 [Clavulina sp. PMI_390]